MSQQAPSLLAIRVKDGIFVGNSVAGKDEEFLALNKVSRVVNCAGSELANVFQDRLDYATMCWEDCKGSRLFNSTQVVRDVQHFVDSSLARGECVLIHSVRGVNRASTMAVAYFMCKYGWCLDSAIDFVTTAHPDTKIPDEFLPQLESLQEGLTLHGDKDILHPDIDTSKMCLDNEQWCLRNTYLNSLCLVQEERGAFGTQEDSDTNAAVEAKPPSARRITFDDTFFLDPFSRKPKGGILARRPGGAPSPPINPLVSSDGDTCPLGPWPLLGGSRTGSEVSHNTTPRQEAAVSITAASPVHSVTAPPDPPVRGHVDPYDSSTASLANLTEVSATLPQAPPSDIPEDTPPAAPIVPEERPTRIMPFKKESPPQIPRHLLNGLASTKAGRVRAVAQITGENNYRSRLTQLRAECSVAARKGQEKTTRVEQTPPQAGLNVSAQSAATVSSQFSRGSSGLGVGGAGVGVGGGGGGRPGRTGAKLGVYARRGSPLPLSRAKRGMEPYSFDTSHMSTPHEHSLHLDTSRLSGAAAGPPPPPKQQQRPRGRSVVSSGHISPRPHAVAPRGPSAGPNPSRTHSQPQRAPTQPRYDKVHSGTHKTPLPKPVLPGRYHTVGPRPGGAPLSRLLQPTASTAARTKLRG